MRPAARGRPRASLPSSSPSLPPIPIPDGIRTCYGAGNVNAYSREEASAIQVAVIAIDLAGQLSVSPQADGSSRSGSRLRREKLLDFLCSRRTTLQTRRPSTERSTVATMTVYGDKGRMKRTTPGECCSAHTTGFAFTMPIEQGGVAMAKVFF